MSAPHPRDVGTLFMASMVRALLAREKTETRRPIKPAPVYDDGIGWRWAPKLKNTYGKAIAGATDEGLAWHLADFARWRPGDRIWVRETWRPWIRAWSSHVQWRADNAKSATLGHEASTAAIEIAGKNGGHWDDGRAQNPNDVKWRPSLLMPRWASRITIPVATVRAERLTAITDAGVRAEGLVHAGLGSTAADYCRLFREINDLPSDADPWVWVVGWDASTIEVQHG